MKNQRGEQYSPRFFAAEKFIFAFLRFCILYLRGLIVGKLCLIEVYSDIRIICDIFRQSKFAFFESVYDVAIPN